MKLWRGGRWWWEEGGGAEKKYTREQVLYAKTSQQAPPPVTPKEIKLRGGIVSGRKTCSNLSPCNQTVDEFNLNLRRYQPYDECKF